MMTVTKIEPLSKTRYKVYLDGQFAFTLYKGELSRYHIAEESVIEDDIYDSRLLPKGRSSGQCICFLIWEERNRSFGLN